MQTKYLLRLGGKSTLLVCKTSGCLHFSAYPLIRQFGRYLDLEEDELDEVEQFSEYGTKEAFWQTIRFWLEKTDSSELTVGTIIKALKECDVNLKG